jgi:quercetin dioxygenase-like cupin family protein
LRGRYAKRAIEHQADASTEREDKTMDIFACGSRPSRRMEAPSFTGTVWQDPIIQAPDPALLRSAWVRFEPGARTAWHTHPLGQALHITSGVGLVQSWGGPVRQVRSGDTVWFAPGEKHWHGAAPEHAMEHIAMQEQQAGEYVTWLEPVSEEQYKVKPAS